MSGGMWHVPARASQIVEVTLRLPATGLRPRCFPYAAPGGKSAGNGKSPAGRRFPFCKGQYVLVVVDVV